jgi:hypothetical protein
MDDTQSVKVPPLPNRLLQVFFSPGELFAALKENPVWFGAMAVCAVLLGVAMALIPTELWVEMSRANLIEAGQQVPSSIESTGPFIRISSIVAAVIVSPIMMFILAGIMTFVFTFLFGGEGSYKQFLAVVTHASVISSLGALLLVPLKLAQGDPALTLSIGTFFSFLGAGYWMNVLKMLDLFALWSYGVMAIGVTAVDPKRSFGFALAFFMAFALAFALAFGGLMG